MLMSSRNWSLTDWYLTFATAERPRVSLPAAAVQARRGLARPESAIEISRTSATANGFLNCVPGVRVTPGAPISRTVSDHSSELRRSCGGTELDTRAPAGSTCSLAAASSPPGEEAAASEHVD